MTSGVLVLALAATLAGPDADAPARALAEGRFADAAAAIEATAREQPAAQQNSERLWLAGEIRSGLGQTELAEADLSASERAAAVRSRAAAAELFWRRRTLLTSAEQRLAHAQTYLRRHAAHGGVGRRIVAESTVATMLRRTACTGGLVDDLCISLEIELRRRAIVEDRRNPWRRRDRDPIYAWCGPEFGLVTGYQRVSKLAGAGEKHLRRVLALARTAGPAADEPEVAEAIAAAELALLDVELEAYLANDFRWRWRLYPDRWLAGSADPADARLLARQRRESAAGRREFEATLATLDRDGPRLRARYEALASRFGSGPLARSAWLRAALVTQHHAGARLRLLPEGGFPGTPEIERDCAIAGRNSESLKEIAKVAYTRCLDDATARREFDEVAALCEHMLVAYWRVQLARLAELVAAPGTLAREPGAFSLELEFLNWSEEAPAESP